MIASILQNAVGSGRIQGGWEYVYAGYGVAWSGICLYAFSLWFETRVTRLTKNRLMAVVALALAISGLALVSFGNIGKNLVYYWSPSETLSQGSKAYGATIRLGGIVQKGSLHWEPGAHQLNFRVADNKEAAAPSVQVLSTEVPPQMFREGIGVVVEGTFDKTQVFTANRLMVNHSNEYRPPKADDASHPWKNTVQ